MSQRTSDIKTASTPELPAWGVVMATVGAGFAAAMQLGKVPPALESIGALLDASLPTLGWIASMLGLVGAVCAIGLGLIAQRLNPRIMILVALVCISLASFVGSYASSAAWLILTRIVEGFGLVTVAVAAPRMIVANAGLEKGFALGVWSCYVPVGMSLGAGVATIYLASAEWREVWLINAILCGAYVVIFALFTASARPAPNPPIGDWRAPLQRPGVWLLGFTFACYALNWMALMTWLPNFANSHGSYTHQGAAWLTTIVIGANAIGNIGGAWMIRRGVRRATLIIAALILMAVLGPAMVLLEPGSTTLAVLAILFSAGSGGLPAAIISGTVTHARSQSEVAPINGVVVQCSQLGQLAGAPLFGWLIARSGGYEPVASVFVVMSVLGIGLLVVANRLRPS